MKWVLTFWTRVLQARRAQAVGLLAILAAGFLILSVLIHVPDVAEDDVEITQWVQEHRTPFWDTVFGFFTFLGNTLTMVVLAAVLMLVLFRLKKPHAAIMAPATLVGLLLNMLLKEWVQRPRPSSTVVDVLLPTIGLSFPSGHAMASTMFYGFLAFLAWIYLPHRAVQVPVFLALALLPFLISLSRVYVGAHWLSDVVGGITAGLFFLIIFAGLYRRWTAEGEDPKPKDTKGLTSAKNVQTRPEGA